MAKQPKMDGAQELQGQTARAAVKGAGREGGEAGVCAHIYQAQCFPRGPQCSNILNSVFLFTPVCWERN